LTFWRGFDIMVVKDERRLTPFGEILWV